MALLRKDKPDWFALIDKVKAIREIEMGTGRDLAAALRVNETRITEWVCYMREAKAQKTLEIEQWVVAKEREISEYNLEAKYIAALRKVRRSG
jgi:hypothetical protein